MDQEYIDEMLQKLRPVLKDVDKAEAILRKYWKTRMALIWDVNDVHRAANERDVALTPLEAVKVVKTLHHQHNQQYGIRWEDLTTHIEDKVLGRKLTIHEIKQFVEKDIITIHK